MNIAKMVALLDLFRKGQAVANKEAWKSGQVTATALGAAVLAGVQVAKAFGYELPAEVNDDTVTLVAGAVVSVVNIALTYITSEKAGILPAKDSQE